MSLQGENQNPTIPKVSLHSNAVYPVGMYPAPEKIHIGIAFDQNYIRHFFALFTSILKNKGRSSICIHAIITGVSKEDQEKISGFAKSYGAEINYYEIDEEMVRKFVLTSHWSSAVYYRLFFPLLVPKQLSRLLYLDTDIIVLKELSELYATDLQHYPIAGVYDNWVKTAPQLGIEEEGNYFNSGMMLINLPEWRRQRVSELCFEYLAKYPERIKYVDQDALNAVLRNNWKKLDHRFNLLHSWIPEGMTQKEKENFLQDKVIIHYTLHRPWKMLCQNPFRSFYHHYLSKSPYQVPAKYVDFSWGKVPSFIKIRIIDTYHNLPWVKNTWQWCKAQIRPKNF